MNNGDELQRASNIQKSSKHEYLSIKATSATAIWSPAVLATLSAALSSRQHQGPKPHQIRMVKYQSFLPTPQLPSTQLTDPLKKLLQFSLYQMTVARRHPIISSKIARRGLLLCFLQPSHVLRPKAIPLLPAVQHALSHRPESLSYLLSLTQYLQIYFCPQSTEAVAHLPCLPQMPANLEQSGAGKGHHLLAFFIRNCTKPDQLNGLTAALLTKECYFPVGSSF